MRRSLHDDPSEHDAQKVAHSAAAEGILKEDRGTQEGSLVVDTVNWETVKGILLEEFARGKLLEDTTAVDILKQGIAGFKEDIVVEDKVIDEDNLKAIGHIVRVAVKDNHLNIAVQQEIAFNQDNLEVQGTRTVIAVKLQLHLKFVMVAFTREDTIKEALSTRIKVLNRESAEPRPPNVRGVHLKPNEELHPLSEHAGGHLQVNEEPHLVNEYEVGHFQLKSTNSVVPQVK